MQNSRVGACVLVVEQGAQCQQALIADSVAGVHERAMVAQHPDETPAELALRVRRRIQLLSQGKVPVEAVVIVASDATDDETFQSRCQIAALCLAAMRGAASPRLSFVAPRTLSDEGRHELLSIVGTLTQQVQGSPVEISVRFAAPRRQSGALPAPNALLQARARNTANEPLVEVA